MSMLTVKEICDEIKKTEKHGKAMPNSVAVTRGMTIREAPKKEGLVQITPEQALSIYIERLNVNGAVEGYQRVQDVNRCRRIADVLASGKDIAEISLGLDSGKLFCDDGGHRLIACVIARKPIWAVIRKRSFGARAERFANQRFARRVNADVLALAADGAIERYIQDAVVVRKNGGDHPWATLVGHKNTQAVIGPAAAVGALTNYTLSIRGTSNHPSSALARASEMFSPAIGEELARLYLAFGTKSTNPLAFRPIAIRAIADTAVLVIAREGRKATDIQRWERHMSSFDWSGFAWVRSSTELVSVLIRHWNKRLGFDKKIRES